MSASGVHVALWEPEIPPNTGNIARLCAAVGAPLHLIGRLGFRLDERSLKRAGLDYWPFVEIHRYPRFEDFRLSFSGRVCCFSARGQVPYTRARFRPGDCLLFGSESRGLPDSILDRYADDTFVIPMPTGKVRSLNLATAVAIVVYEALRQLHNW
jgi:tRNA (cytidine/uridine-2'-O-)-methyltransferase